MPKDTLNAEFPRVAELPFDSDRKLMSTVNRIDGKLVVITKGAFDVMAKRCVAGNIEKARETYNEIILLDNCIDSGFNASAKYLVQLQGIPMSTVTRAGATLSPARRRSIESFHEYATQKGIL